MVGQHGFVHRAGVVIQAARDGEIQAIRLFRHAQRLDQLQHLAQLGHTGTQGVGGRRIRLQRRQMGQRIVMSVGSHSHEGQDAFHLVRRDGEFGADQRIAHVIGAALVQLVHFAQHRQLALALGHAQHLEEAAQQFAIVELHGEIADAQLGEHGVDDRQHFSVITDVQRILADHVDVALVELAETAPLRTFAAVDPLHLVAAEREGQLMFVLGHVSGQRHGEIETQRHFRQRGVAGLRGIGQHTGGLHESSNTGVSTGRNPKRS